MTKQEYESKCSEAMLMPSHEDRDNYLDEVKDAYIASLESDNERLTKAVDALICKVPDCPGGFNDNGKPCPYPHDKEGCLKCWKQYLMGDE